MLLHNTSLMQSPERSSNKAFDFIVFVAVFLMSAVGAQIGPLALNFLGSLILLAALFIRQLGSIRYISFPILNPYFGLCAALLFSSLCALFQLDSISANLQSDFISSNLTLLIQIVFVYLPTFALARRETCFLSTFSRALIMVCRIQMIWGLSQYLLWEFIGFDLNQVVLVDTLGGLGQETWTALINLGGLGGVQVRMTGINHDGAFLGLLLIMGLVVDKNPTFRILYSISMLLSMQRTTLVVFAVLFVVYGLKRVVHGSRRKIGVFTVIGVVALVASAIYAFISIPELGGRLVSLLGRFTAESASNDVGTSRHVLYLPAAVEQVLTNGILIFLFGIGIKSSGMLFSAFDSSIAGILNANMNSRVWAIESDIATVIAGGGLVGAAAYLRMYLYFLDSRDETVRALSLALFSFGFMYCETQLPLVQIVYIAMACLTEKVGARHTVKSNISAAKNTSINAGDVAIHTA